MYYLVYGLLYTISLLPLRVLYVFSEIAYGYLYYIQKYRRQVVKDNLEHAFPEKSAAEIKKITKQFYRNFTDTFIESLKMLSISRKEAQRRSDGDFELINELIDKGYNIHLMAGHQFNWEFANLVYAMNLKIPFVGLYTPIANKVLGKIFFKSRSRFGTVMVSTKEFTTRMHTVFKEQYLLGLAADQNPGNPANAFWLNFFNRPAPFITGPGKGAVKYNTAVIFVAFKKIKRGRYQFRAYPIADQGAQFTPEELTIKYKNALEKAIEDDPSNYLWAHRRWRHEWKAEYGEVLD